MSEPSLGLMPAEAPSQTNYKKPPYLLTCTVSNNTAAGKQRLCLWLEEIQRSMI